MGPPIPAYVVPGASSATEASRRPDAAPCGSQSGEIGQPSSGDQVPAGSGIIERFNRTYREEVLDAYVFTSIGEVQQLTDEWLTTYNDDRPHDALGRVPPTRFLPRPPTPPGSPLAVCP